MKQSLVYRLVICPEVPPLVVDCIIASLDSTLYSGKLHYLFIFSLAFSLSLSHSVYVYYTLSVCFVLLSLSFLIFFYVYSFCYPFFFYNLSHFYYIPSSLSRMLRAFCTLSSSLSLSLACSEPFALSLHHHLYR